MNWEHVAIWIVCISTGLSLGLMIRARMRWSSPWFIIQACIFVGTLGGSFFAKKMAAGVGGGTWVLLILVPSLLMRWLARLSSQRRYHQAIIINTIIGFLHPFQTVRAQNQFFQILQWILEGKKEKALHSLQELSTQAGPLQKTSRYFILFLEDDWEGLIELIRSSNEEGEIENSSQLFWMIRSLAELGQIEQMVDLYMEEFERLGLEGERLFDTWATMMAFSGHISLLQQLFKGPLFQWTWDTKELLLAVAELTGGQAEQGKKRLTELLQSDDAVVRERAQVRLDRPPKDASLVLREDQFVFLEELEARILRELPYDGKKNLHKRPILTWLFAGLLCGVFAVSEFLGGSTNSQTLLKMGAMVPELVRKGEYWRLFAFPLLHYGPIHMVLNVMALLLFGPFVERTVGAFRFLFLLLVSAVGGGILIVLFAYSGWDLRLPRSAYVGASGAIFGLIGGMLTVMLKGWWQEGVLLAKKRVGMLLLIIGLQTIFDLSTPSVSLGAHWSGLLLGAGCVFLLWHPSSAYSSQK